MYFSTKELKKSEFSIKYSVIGLAFYLLVILPLFGYNYMRLRPTKIWHDFKEHPWTSIDEIGLRTAPVLYGNIMTMLHLRADKEKFREYYHVGEKILPEGMVQNKDAGTPQKIFFVVGESSTRTHYSLYGYPVKTTPRLDEIQQTDSTFRFYNGLASAGLTRDVLRLTLTHASPNYLDRFFHYKTVIDMANDAGYETVWIAQSPQLGFDSDAYINAISKGANKIEINYNEYPH